LFPTDAFQFDKNEVLVDALGGSLDAPTWMYKAHLCALPLSLYIGGDPSHSDVSRSSEVTISAYLRTAATLPGQNRSDMGNDLFLGGLKFTPGFDSQVGGQISCATRGSQSCLQPVDSWVPATAGTGRFHIQVNFKPRTVSMLHGFALALMCFACGQESLTIQDFDLLKVIGKGSFGKVSSRGLSQCRST
jgi:serum/glucocorticoid-regulated kinase 2